MYRTTSVLALGLFLGFAPIGALAQTQTDDTSTQQVTPPSTDTQQSTDTQSTDTVEKDDQQSTQTQTLETDDQETTTETQVLETEEQETTETEVLETDEQETTETDTMDTDEADTAATGDAEEADTAASGQEVIPEQEKSEILASSLMGAEVHLADESIGTVSDIIIGEDHMIKGVVVGVGGFLGIGEKRVALPMEKITVQPTEEVGEVELSTSNTREELEAFEEFKTASDVEAEEEAAASQQQMQSQQPAAPTQPAAPQQ